MKIKTWTELFHKIFLALQQAFHKVKIFFLNFTSKYFTETSQPD